MSDANGMTLEDFDALHLAISNYREVCRELRNIERQSYLAAIFDGNLNNAQMRNDTRIISFGKSLPELQEISDAIREILLRQMADRKVEALKVLKKHNFNVSELERR